MKYEEYKLLTLELTQFEKDALESKITEEEAFVKIGRLDKKYANDLWYHQNIEGIICNVGADMKSINILNFNIGRLKKKIERKENNQFNYNLSNSILALAEIECPYLYTITNLLKTNKFNTSRNMFQKIKDDEFGFYEQSIVNSANILEKYGRNFEAIYLYDKALRKNKDFGMALGNKALAIDYYIRLTPHKYYNLMREEINLLENAIKDQKINMIGGNNTLLAFKNHLNTIKKYLEENKIPINISERNHDKLSAYKKFMLENNIILNYEFGYYHDELSLKDSLFPNLVVNINEKKYEKTESLPESIYFCFQVFNQIVETYTTSRLLFFQSLNKNYNYIDKNINYMYHFDFVIHGVKYGIMKTVFCNLYNCLDKIAHLVIFYFVKDKKINQKDIYFDWLQSKIFSEIIEEKNDFQLLALRNLSLDFEDGYQYYHLKKYRNRITHSFLNVNEGYGYLEKFSDYEITEETLIENVNLMFKIVKAALLYFTIAVENTKPSGILFPKFATFERDIYF
jgi:hypothetical protein